MTAVITPFDFFGIFWYSHYMNSLEAETGSNDDGELLVAARMARVLLDPDNQLLLETLYEGSSFTPVIGEAVGLYMTGDKQESDRRRDQIIKGRQRLERKGVLSFERHDFEVGTKERPETTTVIEVSFDPQKAQAFLQSER